ncbi:L-lactate dehydrogenase [Gryllotalpicola ginsengisoli]|uniref:L-lactate dehydrogenase n=1 Tax=Gryllotalpicola ginsengisoli TaxID=444608 RepID=UPI0003B4989E|nr:L-lactate dehydrogenase [Gryllotalpicola ginsengisoli]
MVNVRTTKLGIIGAGAVGTSLAYAALIRGAADEVAIQDVNAARAEAQVLDLAHGTPFAHATRIIGGGDLDVIAGSDVIVITAGASQQPGQSRLDLVNTNADIIRTLMPQLVRRAPDAVYLLVTNPVDVLTVVATDVAGLRRGQVIGSGTTLDSSRLRWLVAERAGVAPRDVSAMILGEHGDSEFPLWSRAAVGGSPIRRWADEDGRLIFDDAALGELASAAVQSAYAIIAGKGATNYAIGLAACRMVEAVLRDEHMVTPVSIVLRDYLGVDGIALSVPCVLGSGGVQRVLHVEMDAGEQAAFLRSAEAMQAVLEEIGQL